MATTPANRAHTCIFQFGPGAVVVAASGARAGGLTGRVAWTSAKLATQTNLRVDPQRLDLIPAPVNGDQYSVVASMDRMSCSVNDAPAPPQQSPRLSRQFRKRIRPHAAVVRRRLLDGAMQVFAERGFAGASIDDIAAAAGFTKGAVYSQFAGKDDLFFTLLSEQISTRIELIAQTRAIHVDSAEDAIRSMGEKLSLLLMGSHSWQMLFLEFWQRAAREPEVRKRYVEQRLMVRRQISHFIENEAARLGISLTMDPEDIVNLVLALGNGLFIEEATTPGTVRPDLLSDVLVRLLTAKN